MKLLKRRRIILFSLFGLGVLLCASLYIPIPRSRLDPQPVLSLRIEDRNGLLLREVLSDEGGRCRWVGLAEISPALTKAAIASEDRSFFVHPGINVYAVARAFVQNLRHRRIVSGASTITEQVIRCIYGFRRNVLSKALEAWMAVRLEHTLSKAEILTQYLNRISYGNQACGIEAASRLYFDKAAIDLSLAESAFLAILPRAPSEFNPYRNFEAAKKRQSDLVRRMVNLGIITQSDGERAVAEPLGLRSEKEKFRAPHFCDFILQQIPPDARRTMSAIRTTLDYNLQEKVEILLKNHLAALEKKGVTNGAAIVLDNVSGEILSMAGSRDFFDERHGGQVNGSLSRRQPGSTMKPLMYALALEKGFTASSILEDVPTQFLTLEGSYMPENYDEKFHGPIRLRSALASSYNIPAVYVLQTLGPDLLYRRLKDLEFTSLQKTPGFYGVGLTLGNGEVTLLELVRAYASLARAGLFKNDHSIRNIIFKEHFSKYSPAEAGPAQVFSPEASYVITHILADKDARIPTFGYHSPLNFPFPVAVKTGTSKDFRDNWTIGYTPQTTVGVWVGNFDGRPMESVSGMTGAGPLFRDIMLLVAEGKYEEFKEPGHIIRKAICPLSGALPSSRCPSAMEEIFIEGTEPKTVCPLTHEKENARETLELRSPKLAKNRLWITFPRDGDIFKIDPVLRRDFQAVELKALISGSIEVRSVEWWINDRKIGDSGFPYACSWKLAPGTYSIKARAVFNAGVLESRPVRIIVLS